MFESIKEKLPSFNNPFPVNPTGETIYNRLICLEPDEHEAEFAKLSDAALESYNVYLRGLSNKQLVYKATGLAFVGAVGGTILVALSSGDDDGEEDEDEEEFDLDDDEDSTE
jgi:hypothetical protein